MEPSTLRWITLLSRKTLVYLSSALAPYGLTAAEEPFYMSLYYVEGITQEELAAILEVSRQTISSLEKGRYNPSILLAFKIARCFGQSIEEIFLYEEDAQ